MKTEVTEYPAPTLDRSPRQACAGVGGPETTCASLQYNLSAVELFDIVLPRDIELNR